jgi:hypothetical protein
VPFPRTSEFESFRSREVVPFPFVLDHVSRVMLDGASPSLRDIFGNGLGAELRSAWTARGGCPYAKKPPKYKRPGGLARRFLLRNCLASLSLNSFPLTSIC